MIFFAYQIQILMFYLYTCNVRNQCKKLGYIIQIIRAIMETRMKQDIDFLNLLVYMLFTSH